MNFIVGVDDFGKVIREGFDFIDKSLFIKEILDNAGTEVTVITRPRRFGKSLTCSTLKAIFTGRRELFNDLWIGQSDYDWQARPVVYFDFSELDHQTPEQLVERLAMKSPLYEDIVGKGVELYAVA